MALRDSDPAEVGGYRIEDRLGSGGMGVVYLARSASGRRLALKIVHDQYADDDEFRGRFRREVAAARRVSGAFTAPVVDADADADRPWMATLYIPGPTLAAHVRDHGPLPLPALRDLAAGLAEALRDIHRAGVVHRDLKPANVMLAEDGPRVIDFGISRAAESAAEALTQTGRVLGTPPFMSPEQFAAPQRVGAATDVFSLGAVLTYAATGRGPFDSDSPYETAVRVVEGRPELDAVPAELTPFVQRCLEKDPATRPTAADLVAGLHETALLTALTTTPATPAPTPLRPRPTRAADTQWEAAHWEAAHWNGTPRDDINRPNAGSPPPTPPPETRPPTPENEPPAPQTKPPTPEGSPPSPRPRPHRLVLAAGAGAVALAALATTLLTLAPGGGSAPTGSGTGSSATPAAGDLPDGWRPWAATADGGERDSRTAFRGCARAGDSLVCAGADLTAAGFALADGGRTWQRPVDPDPVTRGAGGEGAVIGTRDGTVFGYGADETGTEDDMVVRYSVQALAADTGEVIWRTGTGTGPLAFSPDTEQGGSVAVDQGVIVRYGDSGEAYALLDAEDGSVRWESAWPRPVDDPGVPGVGDTCALRGAAGHAYLLCTTGRMADGDARTHLYLLDPATGEPRWTSAADGLLTPLGETGGRLVAVAQQGERRQLLLADIATGEIATAPLALPPAGISQGTVHLARDTLYIVLPGGTVRAHTATTGRKKWESDSTVEQPGPPAASATHLYLASPSGRVAALDLRTGAVDGTAPARDDAAVATDRDRGGAPPLLIGDALYVPYGVRSVYTVDIRDL
ncbi:protein kinase [Streptomyces sp. NPDC093252]|uniref:serine/threonine-protein kinase n=1 Tax=Streptomyces sp. NPDC093252 TaxID=3154980 RepID=UPI003415F815